jgi:hypothetical protein
MVDHAYRNPFCALFADMGAGKTATVLSLIIRLFQGLDVSRVLVVAPRRVALTVWPAEIARWAPFQGISCRCLSAHDFLFRRQEEVVRRRGSETRVVRLVPHATRADFLTGEMVQTISRDRLADLVRLFGRDWPYDLIVLDESSGFRDPATSRVKAMRWLRRQGLLYRVVALSGTPRPKSLLDLWSQMAILDGGARLGRTMEAYRVQHFVPDKRSRSGQVFSWAPRPGAEEEVFARISDLCVSLLPEDVVSLPERTINPIHVPLPAEALATYRELERHALAEMEDGDVVALNRAVLVGKLLQVAGGAVYDENGRVRVVHDAKLDALEELIEASCGAPLLVAYWFKHDRDRIKARFTQACEFDDYPDTEARWNRGEIPLLLLHPASGAHGLNLQYNDGHGVWFGPIHDLELWLQWNKRLHRPGRRSPVFIHVLLAAGTIDAAVLESLGPKGEGQDRLLRAVRLRLEELGEA